jgi:uncharacterized membrane protein
MRHFSFRPTFTLRGRANNGLRGIAGKPLHPPLTDLPIAGYLFGAVFDVLSIALRDGHPNTADQLFAAAGWTFLGGAAVSVLAVITGAMDWAKSSEAGTQARRTINAHALTMIIVTVLVVVDLVTRFTVYQDRTSAPVLIVVLSVGSAALVAIGATLGGTLVFDYGFNVETAGDHPVWHHSESDVRPGDEHRG